MFDGLLSLEPVYETIYQFATRFGVYLAVPLSLYLVLMLVGAVMEIFNGSNKGRG